MAALKFAETHNLVAFLSKPEESDRFEQIVDFLNENPINCALTVNPTIYTSCIKQLWATAKAKTVNGEVQIQALGRRTGKNGNLEGGVKFLMYPRFVQVFLDKQVEGMTKHKEIYVTPSHTKKVFANMKREGKGFSGRVTPLFQTMMVQAQEKGEGSEMPNVPQHTSTINQPSSSQPPKKQKPRNTKKQNTKLLDKRKKHFAKLRAEEIRRKPPTKAHKRNQILRKVGRSAQVVSSNDKGLGAQEDASKQGRKIANLNADAEVTLVDEAQGTNDDLMFDTGVFDEQEVEVEKAVSTAEVTTVSATTTTVDELTLAQTLIEIKVAKPKAITTAATTTTSVKARGIVVQELSKFRTTTSSSQTSQLPQVKDKGKAKMIEPEKPLKKKDQILVDEEIAQRLQEELQAELEEEERLARQKEEEDNLISWDNTQAMMEADYELAQRLQAEEQGELTIEERSKLFVELMDKRKKHFAKLRAEEIRRKPPTKAQKRNQMCTYLKNMANYKHSQLKNKSFEEIQMLFDNTMKWVDSFVPMDTEVVEGSKSQAEGSKKRTREELESDNSKKQKIDENVEAEVDDEAEMKKLIEIVLDDEVEIDAIPLATKSPIIVDWKIIKEGKMGYFQIIRADGSSRRYSSMIRMLQNIDREDLETLWKLVKAKHGNTRPEEAYERVLWGDLKVMFEPDVESEVWRNLQGYNVTVWKLFSSSGVHFVRFQNLHIFMLVEKKYPLTPATITKMLNKKLQTDQLNEMCY
ncbi:hypothetical protein Tco_0885542 [Tanacetum coccineum]